MAKKTILKEVTIPGDSSAYLQKLTYELEGYRNIMATILKSRSGFEFNKDLYDHFMNQFMQINVEHNLVLNELIGIYGPEFSKNTEVVATVDFNTETLLFITEEGVRE